MASQFHDMDLFGIIGIGRFGQALVMELLKNGKNVIALDNNAQKLESIKKYVNQVYLIDQMRHDALAEAGIGACGTVIVCIGKDIENNLLATLNAKELGVPRVISKASSADHGRLLEKLGAEVVIPEEDMGKRLAQSLCRTNTLEWLPLCEDFSIIETEVFSALDGKKVIDLNLRKNYGINIIAIVDSGKANGTIGPDTILKKGQNLVISGTNKNLAAFQKINTEN
ncbi:MAG: TrkA family potassium uptake protein [Sphaerochaetaceae bacterium]|jgi:trk system potassium uptake protein TrkA|nr:TrkA family potassium uptake protein [Sphaerochaetaceae bacterium]MDD3162780.1 TrkA family potassium uptake protein [Sphaerochaetaceae bacterium]MDD4006999.1 TrkA family potassium uptake protein [Sphaerochaetaceae bacterium]MDD4396298.1 TrkA family potassium uptake protein [Sphaerochaetaceae bacterium]